MQFVPYVFERDGNKVHVHIRPMTEADAAATEQIPEWQTSWNSDYLQNPRYEKYVVLEAKTDALSRHYVNDFGAVELPRLSSFAPRFLIADEAAKRIFFCYLT